MDEIIKTAVGQVPGLVVLFFVVRLFLQSMKERDALIKGISDESLEARRHSQQVIERNSLVVGENTTAAHEMIRTMNELIRNYERER